MDAIVQTRSEDPPPLPVRRGGLLTRLYSSLFESPEHDRLAETIQDTEIMLGRQLAQAGGATAAGATWASEAGRYLACARAHAEASRVQSAWTALLSARRALLEDPNQATRRQFVGAALAREAVKLEGWRAKAVTDLLCDDKGVLRGDLGTDIGRLVAAVELRDDYHITLYFKISVRRRHLLNLFAIIVAALTGLLVMSYVGALSTKLPPFNQLLVVILLAILGAGFSVAQSLVQDALNAKIPAQRLGAFVVWMRPFIGAAAAIAVVTVLSANDVLQVFDARWTTSPTIMFVLAFIAGYSERFVVGTLQRISDAAGGKDDGAPPKPKPK